MNNKQEKLWFKRRRYGWGWTPVTWQGWLTTVILLAAILASAFTLPMRPNEPTTGQIILFLMYAGSATLILIGVSVMKGPSPRFRWGKKSTDNPEEDH
jgi:hypothetical protein